MSTGGGRTPAWARNGRELFYLDLNGALVIVALQTAPSLRVGAATKLFDTRYFQSEFYGRTYDVTPDGQRFLMIKENSAGDPNATPSVVVALDWVEELKRLVPTK